MRDANVLALRGKVEVIRDPAFSTIAAAVDITTADGTIHKISQSAARGSDVNPMSDRDLEDKLRKVAADWELRHDVAPLIDAYGHWTAARMFLPWRRSRSRRMMQVPSGRVVRASSTPAIGQSVPESSGGLSRIES